MVDKLSHAMKGDGHGQGPLADLIGISSQVTSGNGSHIKSALDQLSQALRLSADNACALLIPPGFAHGFCTLTDDVQVLYKISAFYAPATEGGIIWNDPDLSIDWPLEGEPVLSQKDQLGGLFSDLA